MNCENKYESRTTGREKQIMNQRAYRRLICGQASGFWAVILRLFLRAAAPVYSVAVRLRNIFYSKDWLKIYHVDAPVLSVGNITVGGTGKTPLVIWLCNKITKNYKCAILTRGYKTKKGKLSDEPAILTRNCPEARVIVNPDRVAAATEAVDQFAADLLIMDDGFQHRRLARDLDIVTIDATLPFGCRPGGKARVLPAGLLREQIGALKRADAVVITRCDLVEETELDRIEEKLQQVNPALIITRSIHAPVSVKSLTQNQISIEELKDKKIFAFCGIGNPGAFLGTIRKLGLDLLGSKIYNDHHCYTEDCLTDIYEEARYLQADLILTTQKDWNKAILPTSAKKDIISAYLAIELKFIAGEDKLTQLIEETLSGKISKN
ncbi:MAG: tetraacyldisaccharide 4'-kinase [Planctomycetota bacterium]